MKTEINGIYCMMCAWSAAGVDHFLGLIIVEVHEHICSKSISRYILDSNVVLDQTCYIQNLLIALFLGTMNISVQYQTRDCKNLPYIFHAKTCLFPWILVVIHNLNLYSNNKSHFVTRILPIFWIRILF